MTPFLLTVTAFSFAFILGMGIFLRRESRSLLNKLGRRKTVEKEVRQPFLLNLWAVPAEMENPVKYALIGLMAGVVFGIFNNEITALVLGLTGFIFGPRMIYGYQRNQFEKSFRKQYPRATTALAACAQVGTYVDGFRHVAEEYQAPVSTVFGYINKAIENGVPAYRAIEQAIERYNLPYMEKLADSYKLISEIGAGEKAKEVLESAADQVRFQDRYEEEITTSTAEIRASGIFACVVPTALFIFMCLPDDSPQRYVLFQDRTPLYIAFLVMGLGWLYVKSAINKVKNF